MRNRTAPFFAALVAGLLSACASLPEPLAGDYSQEFQPTQATERSVGARVRWGGVVIETRPERNRTCIEVLAQPLGRDGRPRPSDQDWGRFIACSPQFFDPEIFVRGREVTATGRLTGFQTGQVGEFEYRYPVLEADSVYLWPRRVEIDEEYHYYYWPWWGFGPYPWYHHYPYHSRHIHLRRHQHTEGPKIDSDTSSRDRNRER
ncbi:MAG: hypothetical protein Kow0020_10180 [Wenzhouxiangellaceae bacterium]